ncbi:MAG: hypothetical protein ACR5LF_12195 [Symbiopectobacterium sp.]
MMLSYPAVTGTIAGQPKTVMLIKGVQFSGQALLLQGEVASARLATFDTGTPFNAVGRTDNATAAGALFPPLLKWLPAKWRAIEGKAVARALMNHAFSPEPKASVAVLEAEELRAWGSSPLAPELHG